MSAKYDVIILGCGEAGIFAAYELAHSAPGLKVLAVDQGADIYHRSCPIVAGKVKQSYWSEDDKSLLRWLSFRMNQRNYRQQYAQCFNKRHVND